MSANPVILLIDDDPDLRQAYVKLLSSVGYQLIEAGTGEEGLAIAREQRPDIVLLDVVLPGMDGIEICQLIKTDPTLAHIHVVLVSAIKLDSQIQANGISAGADDYIAQPISNEEFLARITGTVRTWRAEQALRKSEARLNHLLTSGPAVIYTCEPAGNFAAIYISPSIKEQLGYSPETFLSDPDFWFDNIHPADRERILAGLKTLFEQDQYVHEYHFRHSDGSYRWMRDELRLVRDIDGTPLEIIGYWYDITDQKNLAELLEKKLHFMVDTMVDGIITIDGQGIIESCNPAAAKLFGYQAEEVLGQNIKLLMPESYQGEHDQHLDNYPRTGVKKIIGIGREVEGQRKDGSIFPIELTVSEAHTGEKPLFIGIIRDITERKQAEEEIKHAHERLRNLTAQLQVTQEEERARIARDLHDELGQLLTGLKMDLSSMLKKLPKNWKKLPARTQSTVSLVDDMQDFVRKLSSELRPPMLDDLGLIETLEWRLHESANRGGFAYKLERPDQALGSDSERDIAVYRIFQEILTNVIRHANATLVEVSLHGSDSQLVLTVRDNGIGIKDEQIQSSNSLGLTGMRERVVALGGNIRIEAAKKGGTQITLTVPLLHSSDKAAD